jgi:hypothetical protein
VTKEETEKATARVHSDLPPAVPASCGGGRTMVAFVRAGSEWSPHPAGNRAGVVQWQYRSFPSFGRGFDSHRPLHKSR